MTIASKPASKVAGVVVVLRVVVGGVDSGLGVGWSETIGGGGSSNNSPRTYLASEALSVIH